jgi:hypothetical protein
MIAVQINSVTAVVVLADVKESNVLLDHIVTTVNAKLIWKSVQLTLNTVHMFVPTQDQLSEHVQLLTTSWLPLPSLVESKGMEVDSILLEHVKHAWIPKSYTTLMLHATKFLSSVRKMKSVKDIIVFPKDVEVIMSVLITGKYVLMVNVLINVLHLSVETASVENVPMLNLSEAVREMMTVMTQTGLVWVGIVSTDVKRRDVEQTKDAIMENVNHIEKIDENSELFIIFMEFNKFPLMKFI